ncbi:MAG: hypothetical protein A2504_01520 [Bdellovibrionales bacterium RIFOXYD12_FULL_39_22]|nr:MAG: hypothetical protein A2385_04045 [Bdellovibrionales bacterium RIFOXYB1_FULL_39_21]OFZ42415.1 MAG: hypothetical protein A2485_15450 [Bdellovibrionales bacterium RIFOXYC12_FULL_39_17]OFZ46284.1 MAG: hypothetical protein A2404_13565 [Bdellovibrionales bacterium RIFOXYC1_FULL_39_130]OFZ70398.1 MAG: hypothetical protein A2451_09580 [Bdellovibrionales bacterium RIFOXYC2_FULL_39_8]OFZ75177.1 MAG: hypothetical protein A2560_15620 [Bdellovibrionales bacterium RIFOXYD1_FULL_39_84]OFZ93171.1 MAG:
MLDSLIQLFPENWQLLAQIIFSPIAWFLWTLEAGGQEFALKIIFLALPSLFICVGTIATIVALVTIIFRPNRTYFIATVLITWWDGGKSILLFWAGIFRFIFLSVGWIFGAIRLVVMGAFQTIKDIVFSPITILLKMAKGYSTPGLPWIAVLITFFWIVCEALTFSYILTPMAMEIIGGLTNTEINPATAMAGLMIFLFMLIGGSFACMHGLVEAIDKRQPVTIIKMLFIELMVMFIEVLFFYREFVESLAPWFAQITNETVLIGPGLVITISAMAWFGIRAGTWFFFAKYGTPTLLMIISREGMEDEKGGSKKSVTVVGAPLNWIKQLIGQLQDEINWFSTKGTEITGAFVLPPVQVLAVMTNFFMIILTGKNLFVLPIKTLEDLKDTKQMLAQISGEEEKKQ